MGSLIWEETVRGTHGMPTYEYVCLILLLKVTHHVQQEVTRTSILTCDQTQQIYLYPYQFCSYAITISTGLLFPVTNFLVNTRSD